MRFPIWKYLNQPVFSRLYKTRFNPRTFWRCHRIQYLERCWSKEFKPEEHIS
jgi:hypothetical protein